MCKVGVKTGLDVVLVGVSSEFDAAVIARTLYAGLGASGWTVHVIPRRRLDLARLIVESRIPVPIALENVRVYRRNKFPEQLAEPLILVDPTAAGQRIPNYSSLIVCLDKDVCDRFSAVQRVSVLGLSNPVYEAIAILYMSRIRRTTRARYPANKPEGDVVGKLIYFARKCLESLSSFDNYTVLEPSVLVFALRKALIDEGFLLDLHRAEITFTFGHVVEKLYLDVYDSKTLRHLGLALLVYDSRNNTLHLSNIPILGDYKLSIDVERKRVCLGPTESYCFSMRQETSNKELSAFISTL